MSRTRRTVPYWVTRDMLQPVNEELEAYQGMKKSVSATNPTRNAFFNGYDKMGRQSAIVDPEEREEVWGEKNKRAVRTKLSRKARRQGKQLIQEQLEENNA
jgi:hypothetical protein